MEYIISETELTVVINGNVYTVYRDDQKFTDAIKYIREKNEKGLIDLLDELKKVSSYINDANTDIVIDGYEIKYKGVPVNNYIVGVIFRMKEEGFDISPLVKFLENLLQNPSNRAIKELYGFLEYGRLPITSDGCFLAYKKVSSTFTDIHTNTVDNSIGTTVMMNRQDVDDNCNNTCSTGLHFCSLDYLNFFGSKSDPVVILKINPKDVVSIPVDYKNTKGRCCKYEVVGLYTQPLTSSVETAYSDDINDEYEEHLDGEEGYSLMSDEVDDPDEDTLQWEYGAEGSDSVIKENYLNIVKIIKEGEFNPENAIVVDEYNIYCKNRRLAREVKKLLADLLGIKLTLNHDPVTSHPWVLT